MDLIRRYLRLLRIQLAARRGEKLDTFGVSRVRERVWWSEIDELRHMNNSVYLGLMDHARLDLMQRTGIWPRLQRAGIYPVVSAQTITYRKSLQLGQRYVIESRMAGFDERQVYVEQRFVVDGEVYAQAAIAGRMLRTAGGVVPMSEVGEIAGVDVAAHPVPDWLAEWAAATRLPSTREPAPSEWG